MVAKSVSTPPRQVRKCESPQSVKLRKKPQRRPLCDFQARWEKLGQHWKQSCGSHMTDNGEVFDWLEYKPDTQAVGCKLCAKYIAEGPCKPSHRKNTWACYTPMPNIGSEFLQHKTSIVHSTAFAYVGDGCALELDRLHSRTTTRYSICSPNNVSIETQWHNVPPPSE